MSIDCNHNDAELLDEWLAAASGFEEHDLVLRCPTCRAYINESGDVLRAFPREDIIAALQERTKTAVLLPVSASRVLSNGNTRSEDQNASSATEHLAK